MHPKCITSPVTGHEVKLTVALHAMVTIHVMVAVIVMVAIYEKSIMETFKFTKHKPVSLKYVKGKDSREVQKLMTYARVA